MPENLCLTFVFCCLCLHLWICSPWWLTQFYISRIPLVCVSLLLLLQFSGVELCELFSLFVCFFLGFPFLMRIVNFFHFLLSFLLYLSIFCSIFLPFLRDFLISSLRPISFLWIQFLTHSLLAYLLWCVCTSWCRIPSFLWCHACLWVISCTAVSIICSSQCKWSISLYSPCWHSWVRILMSVTLDNLSSLGNLYFITGLSMRSEDHQVRPSGCLVCIGRAIVLWDYPATLRHEESFLDVYPGQCVRHFF